MYKLTGLAILLAQVGSIVAHGGVISIGIGGTKYQGYVIATFSLLPHIYTAVDGNRTTLPLVKLQLLAPTRASILF
jgi:hypothetical protein